MVIVTVSALFFLSSGVQKRKPQPPCGGDRVDCDADNQAPPSPGLQADSMWVCSAGARVGWIGCEIR